MRWPTPENLSNLKETLLVICVIYFYGLSIALFFQKPTFGLDSPWVFLVIGTLFLSALALEALLAWWDRLSFFLWFFLLIVSYVVIGLYVAPIIFGPSIMVFVYAEPLIIVFLGGFAFSFGRVITESFFPPRRLSHDQLQRELSRLPGWQTDEKSLHKTFIFKTYEDGLNFVNRVARITDAMRHHPTIEITDTKVEVSFTSPGEGGVTLRDIRVAQKIDALAL